MLSHITKVIFESGQLFLDVVIQGSRNFPYHGFILLGSIITVIQAEKERVWRENFYKVLAQKWPTSLLCIFQWVCPVVWTYLTNEGEVGNIVPRKN